MPDLSPAEIGQMILDFFQSPDEVEELADPVSPTMPASLAGCSGYQLDQGFKWIADNRPASQIGGLSVSAHAGSSGFSYAGTSYAARPGPTAPPAQQLAYETAVYQSTTNNIDLSRDQINTLNQIGDGNIAVQQPTSVSGDGGWAVGAGAETGPIIAGGPGGGAGGGGAPITIVDGGGGADDIQIAGAGSGPQVQDATLIGSAVGDGNTLANAPGSVAAGGGSGGGTGGTVAEPGSTVNQGGGTTAGGIASTAGGSGTTAGEIAGTAGGAGAAVAGAGSAGSPQAASAGGTIDESLDLTLAGGNINQQTAGAGIDQSADVTLAGRDAVDINAAINEPPVELASVAEPEPLATEAPLDGVPDPDVDMSDPLA